MLSRAVQWVKDTVRGIPGKRDGEWHTKRRQHLATENRCQWCGGRLLLEVHHITPFHTDPSKELIDSNLITLCDCPLRRCHLKRGHKGNYKDYEPYIRELCAAHKKK